MAKLKICCANCGSESVVRDAWAAWDFDRQDWILANVFDEAFCPDCESHSKTVAETETEKREPVGF